MTAEAMLASPDADRSYTTEDLLHQTQNLLQSLSAPQHLEAEEHGAFFAADPPPTATGDLQETGLVPQQLVLLLLGAL